MKAALVLLCFVVAFRCIGQVRQAPVLLENDDIWLLVMDIPEVMETEVRGGCPHVELNAVGDHLMSAMVRNDCPEKLPASGTVGLYTIDRRDGRIWRGVDPVTFVDSGRLQRLRKVLLSRQQLRSRAAPRK